MAKKPELLAPAGDMEKLKMAVLYGADAVYLGMGEFNARRAIVQDAAHCASSEVFSTASASPTGSASAAASLPAMVCITFFSL